MIHPAATAARDDLAYAGVAEHARMLTAGEVSSSELTELSLARIDASQPTLNAFRCVRGEGALEDAREADRRRARGEHAPLLGVPVAIKDDIDLAGEESRFGCPGSFRSCAEDCESVRRLQQAGAVIVGKTNTPELGQWPFTETTAHGVTRNPCSLQHTPGGSSGGAATAVAAGLVSAAVGSDAAARCASRRRGRIWWGSSRSADTDKVVVGACPYAWPWNVLGWPGVNVLAGLTDDGLPLGASLPGPANSEAQLISLAAQLERVERWQERRPPLFAA